MTRRRVLYGLFAVTLIVLVGGWAVWREITKPEPVRAYERLRLGMTKDEVIDTIGAPPGPFPKYDERPSLTLIRESGRNYGRPPSCVAVKWTWPTHQIVVVFDDGIAVGQNLYEIDTPPSLLDRVRKFLGL
jgi:hypothetical protein